MDNHRKPAELKIGDRFLLDGSTVLGVFTVIGVDECPPEFSEHKDPHKQYSAEIDGGTDWVCAYDVHPA